MIAKTNIPREQWIKIFFLTISAVICLTLHRNVDVRSKQFMVVLTFSFTHLFEGLSECNFAFHNSQKCFRYSFFFAEDSRLLNYLFFKHFSAISPLSVSSKIVLCAVFHSSDTISMSDSRYRIFLSITHNNVPVRRIKIFSSPYSMMKN